MRLASDHWIPPSVCLCYHLGSKANWLRFKFSSPSRGWSRAREFFVGVNKGTRRQNSSLTPESTAATPGTSGKLSEPFLDSNSWSVKGVMCAPPLLPACWETWLIGVWKSLYL